MNESVYPENPILIVDDEESILNNYKSTLVLEGINNILLCSNGQEAIDLIKNRKIEMVLLDLTMPKIRGEKVLQHIKENHPDIHVIISTASTELTTAIDCMKMGAFDYLIKPVEVQKFIKTINHVLELNNLKKENIELKKYFQAQQIKNPLVFSSIITGNAQMKSIFLYIESIATTNHPVLIIGETGVGKELIAKAIHDLSENRGPYVPINVAGFDDNMFSDTLFGHKKGAYTGADSNRSGLIEKAANGTIVLDEIGNLNHTSQVKLLRVLESKEYFPLGSDNPKYCDARIIASTNANMEQQVKTGEFRQDLFYRLKTHYIKIPPLRERKEDINLLVKHFNELAALELNKKSPKISNELFTLLKTYNFPGNIRELKAMVFDAVSQSQSSMLSTGTFKEAMGYNTNTNDMNDNNFSSSEEISFNKLSFPEKFPTLNDLNNSLIKEALVRSENNQTVAAKLLGISQQALSKRLKKNPDLKKD